jgi:hypothetical protein
MFYFKNTKFMMKPTQFINPKKTQKLIKGIFLISSFLLISCNDPNDCDSCKGITIAIFEEQDALLFYNSGIENSLFSKYYIELTGTNRNYSSGYVCDTNMVSKFPKKKEGTPIIISGNGKAICGGRGTSVWGYVDIKSVRLK